MIRALYTATSGMLVESRRMDVLAQNLANVQTPGYRGGDFLRKSVPSAGTTTDVQTAPAEPFLDGTVGPLRATGRDLDLALEGEGYFLVQTQAGPAYTRNGNFQRQMDGSVTDAAGHPLLGRRGPLTIPDGAEVQVGADGTVSAGGRTLDQLRVEAFDGLGGLRPAGGSLYYPASGSVARTVEPQVAQGSLEGPNVNGVTEMTRMVETLRAFEAYQKVIQTVMDDTTSQTVRLGRVA
jgi:flagellar basal-body rod protein FlgG